MARMPPRPVTPPPIAHASASVEFVSGDGIELRASPPTRAPDPSARDACHASESLASFEFASFELASETTIVSRVSSSSEIARDPSVRAARQASAGPASVEFVSGDGIELCASPPTLAPDPSARDVSQEGIDFPGEASCRALETHATDASDGDEEGDASLLSSRRPFESVAPAPLPTVGEAFGEFRLLSVLGRGIRGSVFLAAQPSLANRPVVLKITPRRGREHLMLARLQHAHIVPLYGVQDIADRDLRVLCMPYLGGATLARLLNLLEEIPPERRTGRDLLEALDQVQDEAPVALPRQGPARRFLARASYIQAICWIGACLADALHFAHQRELLHLDLKPSNILLAVDGTPMLLDFHLAQAPIHAEGPALRRLGGTPAYMSPEQWTAMQEARSGHGVAVEIDGRSDIYALGRLLYEALGGKIPLGCAIPMLAQLEYPPQLPLGLRDIIGRCLQYHPRDRYPDAALLAEDLRRQMADLPLRGVANRSVVERWRKWRRRRPHALGRMVTALVGAAALLIAGLVIGGDVQHRLHRAAVALDEGRKSLEERDYPAAVRALERGLTLTAPSRVPVHVQVLGRLLPRFRDLRTTLGAELRLARRAETAGELHRLVDRIRLLSGTEFPDSAPIRALERRLRTTWEARARLLDELGGDLAPEDARRLRTDLLELGIFWANLRVHLATGRAVDQRRRDALRLLAEAEAQFGARPVLERERQTHATALGLTDMAQAAARRLATLVRAPAPAWEHYALGRSLLEAGELEAAAGEFATASDLQPQDLWSHFSRGICAYRLRRFEAAVAAFDICVALAPSTPECYYNRARAHAALGHSEPALRDYDRALRLDPALAIAALNRGVLLFHEGRYPEAIADFRRALAGRASPATAHYNLALAYLAQGDHAAAQANLASALRLAPDEPEYRNLERRLRGDRPDR